MKRWRHWLLFLALGVPVQTGFAGEFRERHLTIPEVLNEVLILRPLGLIGTVAGTAIFVASSPFSALASIAPPHDAFDKAGEALVLGPAAYTFVRPFGVYDYALDAVYPIPTDRDGEPRP